MSDEGWTVEMRVFSFPTEEAARGYAEALLGKFCTMPESREYGAATSVVKQAPIAPTPTGDSHE